jgi:hypothetical protein
MNGLAEAHIPATREFEADRQMAKASNRALDFMFDWQHMMLEELVFAMAEIDDRTRTEIHLFNDFVSKSAASHSVKDIRTMWGECWQHQLDFIRRDCDRLFRHGERMVARASDLFGDPSRLNG